MPSTTALVTSVCSLSTGQMTAHCSWLTARGSSLATPAHNFKAVEVEFMGTAALLGREGAGWEGTGRDVVRLGPLRIARGEEGHGRTTRAALGPRPIQHDGWWTPAVHGARDG